jgi:hypothetical protein
MFVVKDQGHCQIIEFMQIAEVVRAHARGGVCALYKIHFACCGRRRIGVSGVTIVTNWLLHLGSLTQLLLVLSE